VDVPAGCWLQVGSQRRSWANGRVLVFDTSVLHEAANEHPTKDR
jgi:aspartyl/asparaginyl beta-hydroxylase (cupin superfamily)